MIRIGVENSTQGKIGSRICRRQIGPNQSEALIRVIRAETVGVCPYMAYEVIIVGAGPAGLSAALTAGYPGLKILVIESASAGGALINKYPWKVVENYLGFRNMRGLEIAERMVEHVRSVGVEIKENETVIDIKKQNNGLNVITNKSEYKAISIILATGLSIPQKLGVKGENLDGVIYSISNPAAYGNKRVVVIGGGDVAVESAIELQKAGADTTVVHRRDKFRTSEEITKRIVHSGIKILYNSEVKEIIGRKVVENLIIIDKNTGEEKEVHSDIVLISIGTSPNIEFLQRIGIRVNEKGNVITDEQGRTNINGIFAAGDVVGRWLRIPQAIGEGGFAGINAFRYVKTPY